ncbi:enoyl reductase [Mytilinidion resinicola]|uniref:Enoyl reductase n=1 Tax=Mytilinidion resinicola TaxID=574789 RepID=A0A6A6Y0Q3_9PEZI|nr:enoyl reductase [Mytilinidion resinicola]KAF2802229.1 enoyl reductase [Mytilinidion resinicola]
MATRKAIVHKSAGVAELATIPVPPPRDDYIIVKTKAVALNPTDWKSLHSRFTEGAIAGCDYAGIVEQVGSAVTNGLKVGDRVAGFVRGADPDKIDGAFADIIAAKGDLQIKIADSVSFEEGATLGVGISTVGQGLYQALGLPFPPQKVKEPTTILIYGGSTATGTLAIQFAKLSGCEVITTSSPRNFDLCRSLGADQTFDYKEPDVGAKIREATKGRISLVFDTISELGSPEISAAAIGPAGGKYSSLLPVKTLGREDVSVGFTLAYTIFGLMVETPEQGVRDYEFGVKFWKLSEGLLNSGKLKAHPAEVREGGLIGILQGLQDLKDGKVSGVKLVYKVE